MAVRIPKRFLWVDSLPKNFSGANPAWVRKLPIDENGTPLSKILPIFSDPKISKTFTKRSKSAGYQKI